MYKIVGGDGKEYGPISADTVRQWISEGRANAQTRIQAEGSSEWVALSSVPEFAPMFVTATPSTISAPPSGSSVNPLALTGFILSLVSISIGLCCCYGLPFSISGITFSAIGLVQVRKEPERYTGRGLAIAGIIIGCVSILLMIVLLALGVALNWQEIQKEFRKP